MKFHLSKNALKMLSGSTKKYVLYYPELTQMYFNNLYNRVNDPNNIGANGRFIHLMLEEIEKDIYGGYNRLGSRFEVDNEQIKDEKETLVRMLEVMPANEYKALVNLLIEPYCHIELDEESQKAIEEAFA